MRIGYWLVFYLSLVFLVFCLLGVFVWFYFLFSFFLFITELSLSQLTSLETFTLPNLSLLSLEGCERVSGCVGLTCLPGLNHNTYQCSLTKMMTTQTFSKVESSGIQRVLFRALSVKSN